MSTVNEELLKELPGEIRGAANYHGMAVAEKEAGREKNSLFLMAMAKDEMQHAEWIHDHLKEVEVEIPADLEKTYQEYKSAHKKA